MQQSFEAIILDHARVVLALKDQMPGIHRIIHSMIAALKSGNAIYICGNGGSAADANHFAAELAGRFYIEQRKGLPVFSLVSNSSTLTAISNDFGYEYVFSKQIDANAKRGDIVVGISTSGKSKNIINALEIGKRLECTTIALTGRNHDMLTQFADTILAIDSSDTPRIQEAHTFLLHMIAEWVERECFNTPHFSRNQSPVGLVSGTLSHAPLQEDFQK